MQFLSVRPAEARAPLEAMSMADSEPLESALQAVEAELSGLGQALCDRETPRIDLHSRELHAALAHAMDIFTHAARRGGLPRELRQRLMNASGEVAAQREALARATAALDRAMDVLLPRDPQPVYGRNLA